MKPRITYSNVAATLALFLALGGTAVAARHYLITSTSQVKPSVLSQLRGRSGPAGPAGPGGPQGPAGPAGPVALGKIIRVEGPNVVVIPQQLGVSHAVCPSGYRVVSGGYAAVLPDFASVYFDADEAATNSWTAEVSNDNGEGRISIIAAIAYCAPGGQAVTASARSSGAHRHAADVAAERALLARR
jgi:hypothetical protein